MFKKFFLLAAALFAFAAASFAAQTVTLDLNYYCRGELKLLSQLPDGVTMSPRRDYKQKKFADICFYKVTIDVTKVQEFELELEVTDTEGKDSVKLNPSLAVPKNTVVECLDFEAGEAKPKKLPCKITKWTSMVNINVAQGEKIVIKAKFKKPEAAE